MHGEAVNRLGFLSAFMMDVLKHQGSDFFV